MELSIYQSLSHASESLSFAKKLFVNWCGSIKIFYMCLVNHTHELESKSSKSSSSDKIYLPHARGQVIMIVAAPVPGTDSKSNGVFIILFITPLDFESVPGTGAATVNYRWDLRDYYFNVLGRLLAWPSQGHLVTLTQCLEHNYTACKSTEFNVQQSCYKFYTIIFQYT